MKLTAEQKRKYLEGHASACPFCESPDIEGRSVEIDGPCAWQPISCNVCEMEWQDIYKLVDVDDEFCNNSTAHFQDSDCTVSESTGLCTTCGVFHGDPCPRCGGRGYHTGVCNNQPAPVSASRADQHERYIDCGPQAWDDKDGAA